MWDGMWRNDVTVLQQSATSLVRKHTLDANVAYVTKVTDVTSPQLHQEIHALRAIPLHPNIVSLRCATTFAYADKTFGCVVLEYSGVALIDMDRKTIREHRYNILWDVSSALRHLHDHRFAHIDVKPDNVTMDTTQYRCKLIDFGASVLVTGTMRITAGTVQYAAPEVIRCVANEEHRVCPYRADVWSFGVTAFAVLYDAHIFHCAHVSDGRFLRFMKGMELHGSCTGLLNAMNPSESTTVHDVIGAALQVCPWMRSPMNVLERMLAAERSTQKKNICGA